MPYKETARKEGLVAFMDILGFSSIEMTEQIAGRVFGIIEQALYVLHETILSLDPNNLVPDEAVGHLGITEEEMKAIRAEQNLIHGRVSMSLISDSFVCAADMRNLDDAGKKLVTSTFMHMIADVNSHMLAFGLPLRGGVSYGEYYANEKDGDRASSFLGGAIISAHRLEERVDAACIVLDEVAVKHCSRYYSRKATGFYSEDDCSDLCESPVVFKDGKTAEKRICINLARFLESLWAGSERDFIEASFARHGKSIDSDKVQAKIANSVLFLKNRVPWEGEK